MKKILLSCLIGLGLGLNAQYSYTGNFETPGYTTTIYKQFGGGTQSTSAACAGTNGGQLAVSASFPSTGFMIDLTTIGQTGNGQKVDVSVSYKKGATIAGTLNLAYFKYDLGTNSWSITTYGTPVNLTAAAISTCSTLTGTIPAGVIQPGETYGIGVWFVRSGTTTGNIFVDDIILNQESVTTIPACTTISSPTNGATVSAGNLQLNWSATPTAVNYKVKVGTTSGGSNLVNFTVAGTTTNITVAPNTTYYATVTPTNSNGDAVGCTEISFITNNTVAYCGPLTASAAVYPISSVSLNGITKTSPAATGSPAYEDNTTTLISVTPGVTYPITIEATGLAPNRFGATVFIDWNGDGDFADAGESYFTTTGNYIGGTLTSNVLSGDIAVPAGVTDGYKRMRVKYNFNSSATSLISALSDPCGNLGNGQAEDYTLVVGNVLAVNDIKAKNIETVLHPNPTSDFINIKTDSKINAISVVDLTGKKINVSLDSNKVDVRSLPAGTYLINVETKDGISTEKFIKK
ncbi:GEVED domain-containing protein [Chryseobacterium caseinilyticum]|uniref:T9SS type A sorting domain-containing protein n=1 Tax=Chryseobacterium caseinilyticum TaxID=2771428 RepID=A0ABR8Z9A4_9FLAO|nr:GEVED domain-containing protein [Chryseobacterium caseinilyticum]MBD8081810.1 T9SS type A sorting domain-containing protein [Chryseobacterium caseinilyticum]